VSELHAPHRPLRVQNDKERFLVELFDSLWVRYRERVSYVRQYEDVVRQHGGTFVNDHIAFRTLAAQNPAVGIFMISRVFEALGYTGAACYEFPDKHLNSIHYRHPNPQFPKLFITQLKTWELSRETRKVIEKALKTHRPALSDETLAALSAVETAAPPARKKLLDLLMKYFAELPWEVPQKTDVFAVDKESQFGAWTLVNGYDVNHFTSSVDSHGVHSLNDIEKIAAVLWAAGVPMKKEIEGERGTKLRQTSTESAVIPVRVREGRRVVQIPWTYAYFELAERPLLLNPATGQKERFEGFLGGQATNLFEMTKRK